MPEIGVESIKQLLDVLDEKFVIPERNINTEAMFAAEHVYSIQGKLPVPIILLSLLKNVTF